MDNKGHRDRLRTRFLTGGADALADYELLELLLFMAIPRRDVKPLAKSLIKTFGSYAEVLSAEPKRLMDIDGIGESVVAALKIARESALRLSKEQVMNKPVLSSWTALLDYCRASMAYNKTE